MKCILFTATFVLSHEENILYYIMYECMKRLTLIFGSCLDDQSKTQTTKKFDKWPHTSMKIKYVGLVIQTTTIAFLVIQASLQPYQFEPLCSSVEE